MSFYFLSTIMVKIIICFTVFKIVFIINSRAKNAKIHLDRTGILGEKQVVQRNSSAEKESN